MAHANNMMKKAIGDISEAFARAVESRASAKMPGYDDEDILKTIITCAEESALKNRDNLSGHIRNVREEDRNRPDKNKIPKALPAVAPATSALAMAFFNEYWGYSKDKMRSEQYFVKQMMRHLDSSNIPNLRSYFIQVHNMAWNTMDGFSVTSATPRAADHLNPEPLWRLNSKEGAPAQYHDGLAPQLIMSIERYAAEHGDVYKSGTLSRSEATKQIRDMALASMALLDELDSKLEEGQQPMYQAAHNIFHAEYYKNFDAAEIIRKYDVAKTMMKSWRTTLSGGRTGDTYGVVDPGLPAEDGAIHTLHITDYTVDKVDGAKHQLLKDMREAIAEGVLKQIKQDMRTRHPHLSDKQLSYTVNLPISLGISGIGNEASIASTIRHEVESAVTAETIDSLVDGITHIATSDVNAFLDEGHSGEIFDFVESIIAHLRKAFAWAMDKATNTDSYKNKLRDNLTTKAEIKLMEKSLEGIAKDKRPKSDVHDTRVEHAPSKWREYPLSSLNEAINAASEKTTTEIKAAAARQSRQ